MYGSEREKEIISLLKENTYATVEYLAEKIHISPSSVRRDLKRLEIQGLIVRSYGGAEIKNSLNSQIPFYLRSHQNTHEKQAVAKAAAAMVKSGDVIFLDCSTSTYFMLEYLKNIKNITVITNSIASMNGCAEYGINSFCTGGHLSRENSSCFTGSQAEEAIRAFHADLCFFSVQSITSEGILYDCFASEITPRRLMIENSEKRVFICDKSKTNRISAYRLCDASKIDCIISDIDMKKYFSKEYPNINFVLAN